MMVGNCKNAITCYCGETVTSKLKLQGYLSPTLPLFPAIAILTDHHLGRYNLGASKPLQEGGCHYPQSFADILIAGVTLKTWRWK
jgi:hypothetical protein